MTSDTNQDYPQYQRHNNLNNLYYILNLLTLIIIKNLKKDRIDYKIKYHDDFLKKNHKYNMM